MSELRTAAIFYRVSTRDQDELSLDSQEPAVRRVLTRQGFHCPSPYVVNVDWTSLDLMSCPHFQELRQLAELEVALNDSLYGQEQLVMLMGESGIGKTRTAQKLAARGENLGAPVLCLRPTSSSCRPCALTCAPARPMTRA